MDHPETWIVTEENGLRPAGPDDRCAFCYAPLGDTHAEDCVLRTRTVVIRHTVDVTVRVPAHWDRHMIEFHRSDASWCASNLVNDLNRRKESDCLCPVHHAEYLREADPQDEEGWDLDGE